MSERRRKITSAVSTDKSTHSGKPVDPEELLRSIQEAKRLHAEARANGRFSRAVTHHAPRHQRNGHC